jgi:hypothetical protein
VQVEKKLYLKNYGDNYKIYIVNESQFLYFNTHETLKVEIYNLWIVDFELKVAKDS